MQLRMSPGGRMRFSRRRRPELPPSSVTVTIAVRVEIGCSLLNSSRRRETRFLRPRRRVESPVPPPRATTLSPLGERFDLRAGLFTMRSRYDTDLHETVARQSCTPLSPALRQEPRRAQNSENAKAGKLSATGRGSKRSRRPFNPRVLRTYNASICYGFQDAVAMRRCGRVARAALDISGSDISWLSRPSPDRAFR